MNKSSNNLIIILINGLLLTTNASHAQNDDLSTDISNVELSNPRDDSATINNTITPTTAPK